MIKVDKSIWVYWRNKESSYAHANKDVLIEPPRKIGSSITAVSKMVGNHLEQKDLMNSIVGISPNSTDWDKAINNYWNSIGEEIPSGGKKLDLSFTYDITDTSKLEYIKAINDNISSEKGKLTSDNDLKKYIDTRLTNVESEFKRKIEALATITDERHRDEIYNNAYKTKFDSIFRIEADRFKVGTPVNTFEYMFYKYCLVYSDVANTFDLVTKSNRIRFYLHSDEDVKKYKAAERSKSRDRMSAYRKVISDIEKVEDVLYAMGKGLDVSKDDNDNLLILEEESKNNTENFIAMVDSSTLKTRSLIEKYIIKGILKRIEGTSIIVDGVSSEITIGDDMGNAIKHFDNKNNISIIKKYEDRYKGLPN
jgi:hypothetical protein